MYDRLPAVAKLIERAPEVELRLGQSGIDAKRVAVGQDRVFDPAETSVDIAEVVVNLRVPAIEREGFRV